MKDHQLPKTQDILRKSRTEIEDWFYANRDELRLSTNWWVGLAYGASHNAFHEEQSEEEKFNWARLAVDVYHHANNLNDGKCSACIESAMSIHVRLINEYGTRPNDDLLDLQILVRWFQESLKLTFEQVEEISQRSIQSLWENDIDMLIEARRTKVRLGLLSHLLEPYRSALGEPILSWLKIGPSLP